jgi:transcription antitermination factor NusG
MAYWVAARLESNHERYALYCLGKLGYVTYFPRLRERYRRRRGKPKPNGSKPVVKRSPGPPLFPGYAFVLIELQWHTAYWCPAVVDLIMSGELPVRVPDAVIAEIRSREGPDGLISLPKPPRPRVGARVRITRGSFEGALAVYAGMKSQQRIELLLSMLGSQRRVTLSSQGEIEVL